MKRMKTTDPILGLGNDIIEVDRIRKSIDEHGRHFLDRLFSEKEQKYCLKYKDPVPRFAGRFAAKEAIVKALGVGFGKMASWHDIEILNEENGKPEIHFSDALNERFNTPQILLSISHCDEYANAVAIWAAN